VDNAVSSLLAGLHGLEQQPTAVAFLQHLAPLLQDYLGADSVIGYELIPDTGGVPRPHPVVRGMSDTAAKQLGRPAHNSLLGDFIRQWRPYYEPDSQTWLNMPGKKRPYIQFLAAEHIQSFAFLPIGRGHAKLAALLLHYRQPTPFSPEFRQAVSALTSLASLHLAQIPHLQPDNPIRHKNIAVAHTFYGSIAATFAGHMRGLEHELGQIFGQNGHGPPPEVQGYVDKAKNLVAHAMRDLVINASGELLVDLHTMPLSKALATTASALQRAWPASQQVQIDIAAIPPLLDQQPLPLRQLVYTLVMEAVGNAIKHGGPAPFIHVDIQLDGAALAVRVLDHGRGFDLTQTQFSPHGLGFWRAYIEQELGGEFHVASQQGAFGTVVEAHLPVILERK
jgi:signal transduction histidine kinase